MLESSYLRGLEPLMEKMADRSNTENLWGFVHGDLVHALERVGGELDIDKVRPSTWAGGGVNWTRCKNEVRGNNGRA